MKKRGFGSGKWNGFGGKVKEGEDVEQAALRELFEEAGVKAINPKKVAELTFLFPYAKDWDQIVHVFLAKEWKGVPKETEEMLPRWFKFNEIPFEKMWADDKHWLPLILDGKKVNAVFTFNKDNESIAKMEILKS